MTSHHGNLSKVAFESLVIPVMWLSIASAQSAASADASADGDGRVTVAGELKQWHKVTLTIDGPFANELDTSPNPFTDYRLDVRFTHHSGSPNYVVPGYFAADGEAGETSATSGTSRRAHLSPDKTGRWDYEVSFHRGLASSLQMNQPQKRFNQLTAKRAVFRLRQVTSKVET